MGFQQKGGKSSMLVNVFLIQAATGDPAECEYYDDWWIFGEESSGDEDEDEEEDPEFRLRRRRQTDGSGSGEGEEEAADAGGGGNGTVADGDGGNSTKKEIDLSIFSKRCKPEKVWRVQYMLRFDFNEGGTMWKYNFRLLS